MIPVIYASPSLARCLAKALCSTKLYYAATALCALRSYKGVQAISSTQWIYLTLSL